MNIFFGTDEIHFSLVRERVLTLIRSSQDWAFRIEYIDHEYAQSITDDFIEKSNNDIRYKVSMSHIQTTLAVECRQSLYLHRYYVTECSTYHINILTLRCIYNLLVKSVANRGLTASIPDWS